MHAFVLAAVMVAAVSSGIAHIHGKIVAIDAQRGTFQIHHDPFPMMPMAMTMEVRPKVRADLATLHVGEVIDCTVDTARVPWPGTDIHPSKR